MLFNSIDTSTCNSTKGCFRFPCDNSYCAIVTWQPSSSSAQSLDFELGGQTDGWVAIAFSSDQAMVMILLTVLSVSCNLQ